MKEIIDDKFIENLKKHQNSINDFLLVSKLAGKKILAFSVLYNGNYKDFILYDTVIYPSSNLVYMISTQSEENLTNLRFDIESLNSKLGFNDIATICNNFLSLTKLTMTMSHNNIEKLLKQIISAIKNAREYPIVI